MHNPNQESAISGPINLLKHYSFESNYQSYERVLDSWLERFPLDWVNLALVESLYQGRYKVVSVEQILTLWQRRGKASYHFNHDFERLVSNNLPEAFAKRARLSSKQSLSPIKSSSRPGSKPYPILTHFKAGTTQDTPTLTAPSSNASRDVPSPPLPKPSSHPSAPKQEKSASSGSSSPAATQLDATKPSTITKETESASAESVDQREQSAFGTQSRESPSEDRSTSSKSVSMSSPASKTLQSIHQFVPQSSSPEFSSKLTAMAQVNG